MSNQLAGRSHSKKVKVRSLGQTLGGNEVTFFEFTNSESRITKKSIWVLGRQHSGEVTSSFMVEGMI
jgi:murein tripeptide amidase MpaA